MALVFVILCIGHLFCDKSKSTIEFAKVYGSVIHHIVKQ